MLQTFVRKCNHCRRVIKQKSNYLWIKCAVHSDNPPVPGVTPGSTNISNEQQVDLHRECAAPFFAVISDWIPSALPALPAPKKTRAKRLAAKP